MENLENKAPDSAGTGKTASGKMIGIIAAIVALVAVIVAVVLVLVLNRDKDEPGLTLTPGDYTSPTALAMSEDGEYLFVADATGNSVYKVRVSDNSIRAVYKTDVSVQDVTVAGDDVLVAEGGLGGKIVKLNSELKKQSEVMTGHTPTDIYVTGGKAYVANRFSNTVSCIDIASMTETANIAVSREPYSLTLAGSDIYVGCLITDDPANTSDTCAKVCVISTSSNEMTDVIELPNGAGSVRSVLATSDGSTVYVAHILAHYQLPTTQIDGGWINTNVISVISTSDKKVQYGFTLDDVDLGAANPWGLALSDDDKELYVAISGTNQVTKVNISKLKTLVSAVSKGSSSLATSMDGIIDQLNFAANVKTRLTLSGAGVRALLLNDGKLYVGEYFAGNVEVVDIESFKSVDTITLKEQPENNDVRQGELYWYDATICYQMWQSCNSCHPDVRVDGFNWDNLNDGVGNAKQAKSMVYSHRTPPSMVTGIRANAEIAVIAGFRFISFNNDYEDYVPAIDAFLRALQPVPSPYLNTDGTLTAAAQHGSELFVQYGCTECHPAPLYTDMKKHLSADLELSNDWEDREFDTPTLVEVWRSAPWAFNGYFTDMAEYCKFMIEKKGMTISDADAKDLAEFVLSIGAENEHYGVVQVTNEDSTYNTFNGNTSLTAVKVVKQIAGTPDGVLTVTVYDSSGKSLKTATIELKDMVYGVVYEFELEGLATSGGAYYVVTIADKDGNKLASDLKID